MADILSIPYPKVTLSLKVRVPKAYKARIWLGSFIMGVGAWVMHAKADVTVEVADEG